MSAFGRFSPSPSGFSEKCVVAAWFRLQGKDVDPEIHNDSFASHLAKLVNLRAIKTILEIGSGSGNGSTQALLQGIRQGRRDQRLFCLEADPGHYRDLQAAVAGISGVEACFGSSVHSGQISSWKEVDAWFHENPDNRLLQYGLSKVRDWWQGENQREPGISSGWIEKIKDRHSLTFFDLVLIDGSEFTGEAELRQVYGSRWIALDDVRAFKNWNNRQTLLKDPAYRLVKENLHLRNGFSIFCLRLPWFWGWV